MEKYIDLVTKKVYGYKKHNTRRMTDLEFRSWQLSGDIILSEDEVKEKENSNRNERKQSERNEKLSLFLKDRYIEIQKIAIDKPYLVDNDSILLQLNSYIAMYKSALENNYTDEVNKSIISAHDESQFRIKEINLTINLIRTRFEKMITDDDPRIDELLNTALKDKINIDGDNEIASSEMQRYRDKYL